MSNLLDHDPFVCVSQRKQALQDGVLINVTETAKKSGFTVPVAVTRRVWEEIVEPIDIFGVEEQKLEGQLWNILAKNKYGFCYSIGNEVFFNFQVPIDEEQQRLVTLKAVYELDDRSKAVATIMFPDEEIENI